MTMIPKECKRLAEVDFPIAAVSKHSAREKSIRHGHPSTLHLWWARRPLAACRAMLMALLLPDPCDMHCPAEFKRDARKALAGFSGRPTRWNDQMKTDEGLREILLEFIADFANWDNAAKPAYLNTARALVTAAHPDDTPLVVDPFAGGGSIPLEALRIGCDAFASDLNPVACLIQKVLLEDIPRHGPQLADELRRVGAEIKAAAEKELAEFYPPDPDGAKPIAYLWARTVRCESPNCGAEIPLLRSLWLCKTTSRKWALRYDMKHRDDHPPSLVFEVFQPSNEKDLQPGTVRRAKATCPACAAVVSPDRVRAQLRERRGGARDARLIAVVTRRPGESGRRYRVGTERDLEVAQAAGKELLSRIRKSGGDLIPDEALPLMSGVFNAPIYGHSTWESLFTNRQLLALTTLTRLVRDSDRGNIGPAKGLGEAVRAALACVLDRVLVRCTANCIWDTTTQCIMQIFNQGQAIPARWEFAEMIPLEVEGSGWQTSVDFTLKVFDQSVLPIPGQVHNTSALSHPLPNDSAGVLFTDPPYYNAVPYADLSDFFYIWLKRSLPSSRLGSFADGVSPKDEEICEMAGWDPIRYPHKDGAWFEDKMGVAMTEGRRILVDAGVACVVFAHKSTEGWEALLGGMIAGGWTITGSWPITTEAVTRLRAKDSAALAASIHLVCRPRPDDAPVGDWGEVLRELPRRVADWMDRLQEEGVRGADLVFACIGPALEIFSRYSKVETADGRDVPLADYLEKVWEVVGRTALNQVLGTAEGRARNGAAGALEEDARLTALFLWTMQATEIEARNGNGANAEEDDDDVDDDDEEAGGGRASKGKGFSLIFDVARRFAQPLGIHLEAWEDRIIKTEKGVVRLIPVLDRGRQLFGEEGAGAIADHLERSPATAAAAQMVLFPEPAAAPKVKGRGRGRRKQADATGADFETRREATTLDRVHAAMLLQASGRANALRALLKAEIDRGPDFLRLANALSALYPQGSDEKRLLDAMLLAVPR